MTRDRQEPVGPIALDLSTTSDNETPTFLFDRRPPPTPASTRLRVGAAVAFCAYAGMNFVVALGNHVSVYELIGRLLGSFVLPLVAVGISAIWDSNRTEKTRVKVFFIASLVLTIITALSLASVRGYERFLFGRDRSTLTATEFRELAVRCAASRDLACAQDNWAEYLRLYPIDGRGLANLGMVMNMRDDHAQAIVQFQKAVDAGEGAYDLFAYYADSLAKLGRIDEAIDWYYRALSVAPMLVDVRGSLATLLVNRQRPHEALALLQAFDAAAEARGRPAYFAGQRISIENTLRDTGTAAASGTPPLRLPIYAGHYYAPVAFGSARPAPFMIDTGASRTTMSREILEKSKVNYRIVEPRVQLLTADGRKVQAQTVMLESLRVGPFELKDVHVVVCENCVSLLGQATLSRFNLQSSRVQGVEFLTMVGRSGV